MQRSIVRLMLVGCVAFCLTGCQAKEEAPAPAAPSNNAPVASQAPDGKGGVKPVSAPSVEVNPDYNGGAIGSKGK